MVAALKYRNLASRIVALDCSDQRLEVARQCGADVLLNPLKCDVVKEVKVMKEISTNGHERGEKHKLSGGFFV